MLICHGLKIHVKDYLGLFQLKFVLADHFASEPLRSIAGLEADVSGFIREVNLVFGGVQNCTDFGQAPAGNLRLGQRYSEDCAVGVFWCADGIGAATCRVENSQTG